MKEQVDIKKMYESIKAEYDSLNIRMVSLRGQLASLEKVFTNEELGIKQKERT